MVRCTYCTQDYPLLSKTQDEFTAAVMKHVQATHPDKWRMCRPGDVWVVVVPDKVAE
jgi:hypothetical protein